MPRPLSDSWQYFELLPPDNGRSRKARCTFCGHEQAAGITRLHQHLLYRCARIPPDTRDQLRQKQDDRSRDTSPNNNNSNRSEASITSRQQNHHVQFQPSQNVEYHFDPTLQNTLSSNNTTTIAHSSSNSNNTHHHAHGTDNSSSNASLPSYYEAALTGATTTSQGNFSTATTSFAFSPSPALTQQTLEQQPRILQQHPQHSAFSSSSTSQAQTPQDESPQALLDWHLARALFSANIPFEAIENPYMIDFLRHLQPNYVVPKGNRLKQYLLKEQHWDLIRSEESISEIKHHSSTSSSSNFTPTLRPSSSSTTTHDWGTSSPLLNQHSHHSHHPPPQPRHNSSASSSNMGRMIMTNAAAAVAAAAASANNPNTTTSSTSMPSASQPAMDDHILSSMHPTATIDNNQHITSTLSTG